MDELKVICRFVLRRMALIVFGPIMKFSTYINFVKFCIFKVKIKTSTIRLENMFFISTKKLMQFYFI
jgi:hypothetical protein